MQSDQPCENSRRAFIKQTTALAALATGGPLLLKAADQEEKITDLFEKLPVDIEINGITMNLSVEPRVSLLDLLREQLSLTGTKKGCDHGQCGACTVLVDGRRVNSCLSLAVMNQGKSITTIEGLAQGDELHPMQKAFIKHDGFQCGYCTPGQILSAVACVREGHAGTEEEIREFIVKAIREVAEGGQKI